MGYIYCITNTITSKVYIGKSIRLPEKRVEEHFTDWELFNTDTKLTRAILKYGRDAWNWKVIEECNDDILSEREIYWIDKYDSYKNGYNSTLGGDGNPRYTFDKEDILYKYTSGVSAKDIASEYGCHYHCIHEVLREFGVDTSEKRGKSKPIACFDRNMNLLGVFKSKKEIQDYLITYGYGNSLGNVAHFISKACETGKLVYKRYWVIITEDNINNIAGLEACGVHEYNNEKRIANNDSYYKACDKNGDTKYFKKFQSLAKLLNNGNLSYSIQYRLKNAFERGSSYKGITISKCTEEEYVKSSNKLD